MNDSPDSAHHPVASRAAGQRHGRARAAQPERPAASSAALALGVLLCALCGAPTRAVAASPIGKELAPIGAESGLFMPTDVAVLADGSRIAVADGVNDRVVVFDPGGGVLDVVDSADGRPLSRPLGVDFGPDGRLWIADTGNARVVGAAHADSPAVVLPLPAREADVTDVAVGRSGGLLWYVDNHRHALGSIDLKTGATREIGQAGVGAGQLLNPFLLATSGAGLLFVTDVLNGRVALFRENGTPTGSIGTYGIRAGELYRPKGVAVDAGEIVWVTDGTLGVAQAFHVTGELLGALRDEAGQLVRFESPAGVAIDASRRLYVAELPRHRVRVFQILSEAAETSGTRSAPLARERESQPRNCTACHFEWMADWSAPDPERLTPPPAQSTAEPYVSRAESCLSCHDGSIVDSRRHVWLEHGHSVGQTPSADVVVPADLPLVDGRIACRTCHSAHTRAGSGNLLKDAVFLRAGGDPVDLCRSCHTGHADGLAAGMHPMQSAGGDGEDGVTCLSCHRGHGATYDALLVADPDTNGLCLDCHRDSKPALFDDAVRSAHGRMPALDGSQRAVIDRLGTRMSASGELLCTSCHDPHAATFDRALLAFDPDSHDACGSCHAEQLLVLDSGHDLVPIVSPIATAAASTPYGACGPCHQAHQFARPAVPTPADATGRCTTCHADGAHPSARGLPEVNHPEVACRQCHDPHRGDRAHFLCMPASDNCQGCHAEQSAMLDGPHALRAGGAWPEESAATGDACLACHRMHGDAEQGLFRIRPVADVAGAAGACAACHADAIPGSGGRIELLHPQPDPEHAASVLGTTTSDPLTCATCHDPHAATEALVRTTAGAAAHTLCIECHTDAGAIEDIGHASNLLTDAGFEADACGPCHVVHGAPSDARYLWNDANTGLDADDGLAAANHYCVGCHRTDGPVSPPSIATHPDVAMYNAIPPDAAGYLPLFDENGEVSPNGRIACRTCHLTHGRTSPIGMPETNPSMSLRELRARQWHVRTLTGDNLCSTCHGFDALRRFLRFHDPIRRGGPITSQR